MAVKDSKMDKKHLPAGGKHRAERCTNDRRPYGKS